jgi:hypothetical protein
MKRELFSTLIWTLLIAGFLYVCVLSGVVIKLNEQKKALAQKQRSQQSASTDSKINNHEGDLAARQNDKPFKPE